MARFETTVLSPPDAGADGTLFLPTSEAPKRAAVVIGGSFGSEPTYAAAALAEEGIAAISLAYFGRPGLPPHLRDVPLEYFSRCGPHPHGVASICESARRNGGSISRQRGGAPQRRIFRRAHPGRGSQRA